ncbi:MAG: hypothetical protein O2858_12010 [Proteobacteria bacterium]|jgi:hypothetical protein|nr:hypothetical protein [Pseudomonadota bacterium]MDA0957623.1 hypothetical protein [Pseudomonadota bacterium]MDA1208399.1 hypothetical protein [Pseudomonadota bacterium]
MLERYLGGIAVSIALLVGIAFFMLTSAPEPASKVVSVPISEPDKVRTRVDAIMTNCARRGTTTRVEGLVRNLGSLKVTRVTIQSIWKDEDGEVKDTGIVYAIGEGEFLNPGDSKAFVDTTELRDVARCNVRALDWWADE